MLVIRFLRTGKKNQPFFRIVVTDKKNPPRGGRFLEVVGFFNPLTKEKKLKAERIKYWLSVGAQPSDRVHNLLVAEKVIEGKKIDVHKKAKKKKEVEEKPKPAFAKATAGKEEKPEEKEKPKKEKKEEVKKEVKEEKPVEEKKPIPAETPMGKEETKQEKPKEEQKPKELSQPLDK